MRSSSSPGRPHHPAASQRVLLLLFCSHTHKHASTTAQVLTQQRNKALIREVLTRRIRQAPRRCSRLLLMRVTRSEWKVYLPVWKAVQMFFPSFSHRVSSVRRIHVRTHSEIKGLFSASSLNISPSSGAAVWECEEGNEEMIPDCWRESTIDSQA